MRDREIDELLKQAARTPPAVSPELLDRIAESIGSSLRPVRPLPPPWLLAGVLVLICATVAVAGAARSGLYGVQKLSSSERATIFPVLGIVIWLAATTSASEMIPGSRRRIPASFVLWFGSLAVLAVFAILFHDYSTRRFLSQGLICLGAGLLHAIPAGLASWLLLRRGFAVNFRTAGIVLGTLAGLAGLTMLELHCPNFEAPHVMLWHTAVLPLSAAAGALLAWKAHTRASSGSRARD